MRPDLIGNHVPIETDLMPGDFDIHEIAQSQYYESPVKFNRTESKVLNKEMLQEFASSTGDNDVSQEKRSQGSLLKKRSHNK